MNWLVRALVVLIVFYLLRSLWFWFWRSGWKRLAAWALGSAPRTGNLPRERHGTLKRDPVCGTHVDVAVAVCATTAEGDVFFCSEECRRTFLERDRTGASGAHR